MPYNHDPKEQPRCANCGHRRIYHYRGVPRVVSQYGRILEETMVPCSLRLVGIESCGCTAYEPMTWRTSLPS